MRSGLLAEVAPRVRALLPEASVHLPLHLPRLLSGVAGPSAGELSHRKVTPRAGVYSTQLSVTRAQKQLAEDPVDSINVISPLPVTFLTERGVLDQWSHPLAEVLFRRDEAEQIVHLRTGVAAGVTPEPRVPGLVACHRRRLADAPGHRP
jgi:hypothetical protein